MSEILDMMVEARLDERERILNAFELFAEKYEFKTESGYDWIDTENLNRVVMFMFKTPGIKLDVQ